MTITRRIAAALSLATLPLISACPPAPTPPPPPTTAPPPPATAPATTTAPTAPATSAEPPASTTVAIVGGGVAGLVTAYELQKKGVAFHLLEAGEVLGGRVQTAYYEGGLRAEYGLQEVWFDNPLYEIMKELKVPLQGEPEPALSSVVIDGKVYPFVQNTADEYLKTIFDEKELAQVKEWMAKASALRDTALKEGVRNAQVAKLQDLTFQEWIESFKMSKRVNDFLRLTIECELAQSWSVFSALVGLLEYGVFLREDQPAYEVEGGNSLLIKALADAAGREHITTGAMVSRVDRAKEGKKVSFIRNGKMQELKADYVVVAVPPWRLHQIHFEPSLAKKKWEGINTLMRGSYTVVHMIVNKKHRELTYKGGPTPFPVLGDGVTGVIYGPQSEAPAESPNEVFGFLVHGNAGYAFHMVPREQKIKEMLAQMDKLWPGWSQHYVTSYVYTYHPGSITVWAKGRSPLDDESDALRTPEDGLYLAGDWLWSGHSDGAARSAMFAADSIAKATGKAGGKGAKK